jgi:glycosyltransferase involved in cell wall biosynthesis
MVYTDCPLLEAVQRRIGEDGRLVGRVEMIGRKERRELPAIYSSADLFLLGSHHEGSGYALTEALSCGLWPVVSDIPSFRRITGDFSVGHAFRPGMAGEASTALADALLAWKPTTRDEVLCDFEERMSPRAVGRAAVEAYREILEIKRVARRADNSGRL